MIIATVVFIVILTVFAYFFGKFIAFIYENNGIFGSYLSYFWGVFDKQTYILYFNSLVIFNTICLVFTFLIIFFQEYLPLKEGLKSGLNFAASLNAAVSFATGTFWQSHNPEIELSLLSKIFALTMQNFISGGTGIAVFAAFTRGIINNKNPYIGNFYEDFIRSILFILLPIALILALLLISQSVPHDFVEKLPYTDLLGHKQTLSIGPIAGQVAIKNLVANGGSFFASASAHPFEAPSRAAVIISLFLTLLLPTALIFTYGFLTKIPYVSWSLYFVVLFIILISLALIYLGETSYSLSPLVQDLVADNFNYSGKDLIYDKFPSLMWILSITMGSSGSTNACIENYSPLSTVVIFGNLVISKFVLEGVSSGFFAMVAYLVIAVFLRGLITGKTANFFGKKITINEINYVMIVFLLMPVGVLIFTGITFLLPVGRAIITHHGSQAITDITYNFASAFTNNGSTMTGISLSNDYMNYMTALAMFLGRYPIIYFSLALSGSFANKQTIVTDFNQKSSLNIELSIFLVIIVLLVGVIAFLPLMILGPILEFIKMF